MSIRIGKGGIQSPLQISGCQLWYDGNDPAGTGVVPANGDAISTWADKSGRGKNMTGTGPTFSTYGGQNSILFNNNSLGNAAAAVNVNTLTTFVVWLQQNPKSNLALYYLTDSLAYNNVGIGMYSDSTSTRPGGISQVRVYPQNIGSETSGNLPAATASDVVPRNITCVPIDSTGSFTIIVNGTTVATRTNASSRNVVVNRSVVGSESYPPGGNSIANVSEIIVYNQLLTVSQIQQVEGYLAWKWGLQASLPATHPFRNSAIGPYLIPLTLRMNNVAIVSQRTNYFATGAVQTFTVPAGVFFIRFFLWGAGGVAQNGNTNSYGGSGPGSGAYVEGSLQTTPGTVYSIVAGRLGVYNVAPAIANGGASGGGTGAGGGGFSGIFQGASPSASTVLAIAGGGGGGGANGLGPGGGGGYPSGLSGSGATGGTQSAGGTGNYPGSQFAGGVAGFGGDCCGGGGGGGWYGGGGAGGSQIGYGGGGGSSTYTSAVFNPVTINGFTGPNGVPNGTITLAANEASPYWLSPYGRSGQTGLAVVGYQIQYSSQNIYTYKYVRFTVLQARGGSTTEYQLSEFQLKLRGVFVSYTGVTISPNTTGAEGSIRVFDGNLGTKYFAVGQGNNFVLTSPTNFVFDSYTWGTANDVPDRDPVRWTVEGSTDNSTWLMLDNKGTTTQDVTTTRQVYLPDIILPATAPLPLTTGIRSPSYSTQRVFSYTGADQTFFVPPGVLSIAVYMWGAGGGGGGLNGGDTGGGGAGAMVQGILRVQTGQAFTVIVGGTGSIGSSAYGGGGAGRGFGAGATAGGGGRSALALAGSDIVTAGGGGGGGLGATQGGSATFTGTANDGSTGAGGGKGGTQVAGGAGGTGGSGSGGNGSRGQGGAAGVFYGGGGGGGWYGGGGGGGALGSGGGGGSSYINNLTLIPGQTVLGFTSTDGLTAPNNTSPYYASGIGNGGNKALGQDAGGNGRVVILY